MGYVEAFAYVEELFSEAIVISTPAQINQNGVYLLFDGARSINAAQDELFFVLVVAANSYAKQNGAMAKIDEIRNKTLETFKYASIKFGGVEALTFETGTLYLVAYKFSLEIDIG